MLGLNGPPCCPKCANGGGRAAASYSASSSSPESDTEHALSKAVAGGAYRGFVTYAFARRLERERNEEAGFRSQWADKFQKADAALQEALGIARIALEAIETIYGHAQHCDQCQSFEIAQECRNMTHGLDCLSQFSLENVNILPSAAQIKTMNSETKSETPVGSDALFGFWISEHYPTPESANLKCEEATTTMCVAFPELVRIRGSAMVGVDFRPHWWCETPSGTVIDPTAHQWPGGILFYERLQSEEEPYGKCLNCGDLLFRSRGDGSFHCSYCMPNVNVQPRPHNH